MPQHYIALLAIAGGDNDAKAITVPTGLQAIDVIVDWGAGADGTLSISRRYADRLGEDTITVPASVGINASSFVSLTGAAPAVIVAQRVGSSAGSVSVALVPRVK